jgi:predicted PurR-regulated permease PerM
MPIEDQRSPAAGTDQESRPESGPEPSSPDVFVPWSRSFLRHAALWLLAAIVGGLVLAGIADSIVHRLAGFLQIIVISLFLSFAIEPAVDYLAKRGWRRGAATGLVFVAVFVAIAGLIALLIPAVVSGTRQLISSLPDLVDNLARYLRPLGIQLDQAHIEDQVRKYGSQLLAGAGSLLGGVVQVATGIVGGVFQALTIALFTFYMVAQGPQLRRTVCSRFRPDRQRRILFIWEQAIDQTGGYFYSRLLLAVINGVLMYAVLRWRGVPFAAPLAIFEGIVAEFIPIVGTYIGGAIPVLVALLYEPVDALIVLIWIVVYQQIENYFLSPRLTARTMSLPAPVAFAAALIGGALGGILFAFLALPAAGVILAAVRTYGRYYEVVEDDATVEPALAPDKTTKSRSPRSGWFRRRKQDPAKPPDGPKHDPAKPPDGPPSGDR